MHQSINPTHWLTEEAPEPIDVYWPFFSTTFMWRWISKLVIVVACILLTILFLIPVLVVQGLINLNQLKLWFQFLKSILTLPNATSMPLQNICQPNNHWLSMIFSLVLMHAIAVEIFTLKKLSLALTLIFPLPILTLLFNEYCRKHFFPIFIAYFVEALITKDRGDQNNPSMGEFFDKLMTAYQDPALLPVHFSAHSDNLNAPLITSAEV